MQLLKVKLKPFFTDFALPYIVALILTASQLHQFFCLLIISLIFSIFWEILQSYYSFIRLLLFKTNGVISLEREWEEKYSSIPSSCKATGYIVVKPQKLWLFFNKTFSDTSFGYQLEAQRIFLHQPSIFWFY